MLTSLAPFVLKTEIFIIISVLAFLEALQAWYGRGWRIYALMFKKPLRVPIKNPSEIQWELCYEEVPSKPLI